jgi:transcriptional regulator with XRE-family HTH domain
MLAGHVPTARAWGLGPLDEASNILEDCSSMTEPVPIQDRLARRVQGLRAALGLSLDELAARSGVSRSMISLIERGQSSPTAVVLERLAVGLNVSLASLFEPEAPRTDPVSRRAEQLEWRDPASGYLRRNVSPPGAGSPIQIVEVLFPAGARVTYETGPRQPRVWQQVWVLEGRIDLTLGTQRHRLDAGDCLAMELDQPLSYHNPTRRPARYAVVLCSDAGGRR